MKLLLTMVSALSLGIVAAPCAFAHSFPEEQHPSAGQTLAVSPNEIRIRFDAPIEKLFAKLQVLDSTGKNRATGSPSISDDRRELSAKVDALPPGEYTVRWAVVCEDTHHTEGSYSFAVAGGGT